MPIVVILPPSIIIVPSFSFESQSGNIPIDEKTRIGGLAGAKGQLDLPSLGRGAGKFLG